MLRLKELYFRFVPSFDINLSSWSLVTEIYDIMPYVIWVIICYLCFVFLLDCIQSEKADIYFLIDHSTSILWSNMKH